MIEHADSSLQTEMKMKGFLCRRKDIEVRSKWAIKKNRDCTVADT